MRPTVPQKEAGAGCRLQQSDTGFRRVTHDGVGHLLDLFFLGLLILDVSV